MMRAVGCGLWAVAVAGAVAGAVPGAVAGGLKGAGKGRLPTSPAPPLFKYPEML